MGDENKLLCGPLCILVTDHGLDLVLTSTTSMLWVALVLCGAHAVGIEGMHAAKLQLGIPRFPDDFPDVNHPTLMRTLSVVLGNTRPVKKHRKGLRFERLSACLVDRCRGNCVLRGKDIYSLLWTGRVGNLFAKSMPQSCFIRVTVLALRKGVPHRYARLHEADGYFASRIRQDFIDLDLPSQAKIVASATAAAMAPDTDGGIVCTDDIGFVTSGAFCAARGIGRGIGFIQLAAAQRMIRRSIAAGLSALADCDGPVSNAVTTTPLLAVMCNAQSGTARPVVLYVATQQ